MRVITFRKLSSAPLFTFLAAIVFLTSGGPAYSQNDTRSFQMVLWDDSSGADADIATFWGSESQPAVGRTIWVQGPTTALRSYTNIDWSRIVAVEIDEPYTSLDSALYDGKKPACQADLSADIAPIDAALMNAAKDLRALAPEARFWVDFTRVEAAWMAACKNPLEFNRDSAPTNQAQYLNDYFVYANTKNQSCNLPLGSRGVTGLYDGCLVWAVLGFLASNNTLPNGTLYVGLLDSRSAMIAQAWQNELQLPLRPGLAHQRTRGQALLPALMPSLQLLIK